MDVVRRYCFWGVLISVLAGCARQAPKPAAAPPPVVPVSHLIQREVTEFVDFTGRTEAIQLVDIRPRVTGYLVKMPFREGSEVKQGDLLFEIDPRPYQAQYDQAESQVKLYEAQLKLARATLDRGETVNKTPGAISKQELDQYRAAVDEADARLKAFKSSMEVYKLNLDFTKVTSPIDGQVSRYYLTPGNLVNQDQTLLTSIVSLDPIYAYFDVDEPTVLRVRKAINEGKVHRYQEGAIPVYMRLQGEEGYHHPGTLNFVNNQVNPTTGSILVRGIFANSIPKTGTTRLLSPGMFVRIRLPIGKPHSALLVIDRAIATDQGLKYVYVLKGDDTIEYRRVTTGALEEDGMRVITAGLKSQEKIAVGGLQLLRPKMKVQPELTAMPSLNQAVEDDQETKAPGKTLPSGQGQPTSSKATPQTTVPAKAAPKDQAVKPASH